MLEILFWIFLSIVFYTYLGYPIILRFLLFIKERILAHKNKFILLDDASLPQITLVIAAFNEEKIIEEKMLNTYSLNYPKDKFRILWATDGSDDNTNEILSHYDDVSISFIPERRGKTSAVNHAMESVTSPIAIFTDANTVLNSDSLRIIASLFHNPEVGCVSCEKKIYSNATDDATQSGEGAYWKYESKLKDWDYRLFSAVGAAGELFAIRKSLFEPAPLDTLLDDFIISMNVIPKGYKIAYTKDAYAMEHGSADIKNEKIRKVRIAAGGLQSVWRLRGMLNILKFGIFSFQYISHRVLRWTITPIMLFLLYPLNAVLLFGGSNLPIYGSLLILQTLFYIFAIIGYLLRERELKYKIIFLPMYIVFMNINIFPAIKLLYSRRKVKTGSWKKSERK